MIAYYCDRCGKARMLEKFQKKSITTVAATRRTA